MSRPSTATVSRIDDSDIAAYIARLRADPRLTHMDPQERYKHITYAIDLMIDAHAAGMDLATTYDIVGSAASMGGAADGAEAVELDSPDQLVP